MLRRHFLQTAAGGCLSSLIPLRRNGAAVRSPQELDRELTKILDTPVLQLAHLTEPIKIASIELLRVGNAHLLRRRATSGLEVITVPHQAKIGTLYPILLKNVVPAVIGRDARDVEALLWDIYRHG